MAIDSEALAIDAADVAMTMIGMAFPVTLPFIVVAKEAIPALIAAKPYIKAAIANGKSAFAAAEKASPGLGPKIKALASWIDPNGASADQHIENVTRVTAGFAVPGWTDEQTQRWLDNANPVMDDSRVGSG